MCNKIKCVNFNETIKLIIMKMKIKNRPIKHEINSPGSRQQQKYAKYRKGLS